MTADEVVSLIQRPAAHARASSPVAALDAAVTVDHVTKRYGARVALDDVTLRIERGEAFGLLGPNGAGKSTLISLVAGVSTADAGTVSIFGAVMGPRAVEVKRSIGFVPQDIALYPSMSAAENLSFFGRMNGLRRATLRERVAEVLERTGMADRAGDPIEKLSGGMQRRVNIGAALMHRPELLILDEPTVGLDPQSRNNVLDLVETLVGTGITVLYSSHHFAEIERVCERVAIMDAGRVLVCGDHRAISGASGIGERILLTVARDTAPALAELVAGLPGAEQVTAIDDTHVEVRTDAAHEVLPDIYRLLSPQDASTITAIEVVRGDLEAAFLALTGRQLRE